MVLVKIGNFLIPLVVLLIIIYAIRKKVPIYDSFVSGAKEGLELAISVLPYLVAMLFATNILLKSPFSANICLNITPSITHERKCGR